jgi:hypothetical protein
MSTVDAQMFWMSAKIPNDQFLLYAFAEVPADFGAAVAELRRNAESCGELRLRVVDDCSLRYPRWVDSPCAESQFEVHEPGLMWQECLDSIDALAADQLDVREMSWRAHIYPNVAQIPGASLAGSVIVLQIAHSLGDGTRAAALAGVLFGRPGQIRPVIPDRGFLVSRAVAAARAHRQLVGDVEAGRVPAAVPPRPVLSINRVRSGRSVLHTFRVNRGWLMPTVTVGAMVAISEALGRYLDARGEDVSRLAAEVPMRNSSKAHAHNNFRNVSVGLQATVAPAERAQLIVEELAMHRRRGAHPAMSASRNAFAATPAPLLRWGVRQFDPTLRSDVVAGNTVISSVDRGAADLSFGHCSVMLTAGFPALSPMQSLTHGVHGIGDAIAISVHADPSNIDVDEYLERLLDALQR